MAAAVGIGLGIAGVVIALAAAWFAYGPHKQYRADVSRAEFLAQRAHLNASRPALTAAASGLHPGLDRDSMPGMLTKAAWVPQSPLDLDSVEVELSALTMSPGPSDALTKAIRRSVLPLGPSGRRLASYSEALLTIDGARPGLFRDDLCYHLADADLAAERPFITCKTTTYFQAINVFEPVGHELAAADLRSGVRRMRRRLAVRACLGDPTEMDARPSIFAIGALTVRRDGDDAAFFLQQRDVKQVATGGNVLQVAPGGVFQPTAADEQVLRRDLDLWLTLCREYAEEFLDHPEARGEAGTALSYDEDEPYRSMQRARHDGHVKVYVFGMGMDPVTLFPDLVCVAIWRASVFDSIFGKLKPHHEEGQLRGAAMLDGHLRGFPLTQTTITELLSSAGLAPAARAALSKTAQNLDWLIAQPI